MLGATLAGLAAAHLVGAGETIDAVLAAFAFVTAGWNGLVALKDIVAATVKAALAKQDSELSEAAEQFAGGLTVLGEAFLAFVLARLMRRGGEGKAEIEGESRASDVRPQRRTPGEIGAAGEAVEVQQQQRRTEAQRKNILVELGQPRANENLMKSAAIKVD